MGMRAGKGSRPVKSTSACLTRLTCFSASWDGTGSLHFNWTNAVEYVRCSDFKFEGAGCKIRKRLYHIFDCICEYLIL